jgi:hypothetical protein
MRPSVHRAHMRETPGSIALAAAGSLALAVAIAVSDAAAQPSVEEPIRVEDRSAAGCTSPALFYARMSARTRRVRLARADEPSRLFIVQIAGRGEGQWGRLTIRDHDGRESQREIRGRDCGEVLEGLALVAALAVDPTAAVAKDTRESNQTTPPAVAPSAAGAQPVSPTKAGQPVSPTTAGQPVAPTGAQPVSPTNADATAHPIAAPETLPATPDHDKGPEPQRASRATWSLGASVHGSLLGAVAPQALLGGGAAIDWRSERPGAFSPLIALSVDHDEHATFTLGGTAAEFSYLGAALDACPVHWAPAPDLGLRACGRLGLGRVSATGGGSAVTNLRVSHRAWADLGAGVRLDWSLWPWLALSMQAGGTFPLRRDSYDFGTATFHDVPWIGGFAFGGIRVRVL